MATTANVALKNVSKRMRVYTLTGKHLENAKSDHPHRYREVKLVTVHQANDGSLHPNVRRVPMAGSLRIPSDATIEVHPDVLHAPSVRAAIARNELRIIKDDGAKEETKPAAPVEQAVEAKSAPKAERAK